MSDHDAQRGKADAMAGGDDVVNPDDLLLTAYLDGELEADARAALDERFVNEPELRVQLHRLASATKGIGAAFDALLAAAPRDRMQARVDRATVRSRVQAGRSVRRTWFALAAAIVIFILGGVAGRLLPVAQTHDELNWRQAVAEYQSLTTAETLAAIPDVPGALGTELTTISGKLSVEIWRAWVGSWAMAGGGGVWTCQW